MKEEKTDYNLKLRSEEVQEIMSKLPNWMVRWGTTIIFFILLMLIYMSWIIKYPDVIGGELILTTQKRPIDLVCKSNGQLSVIHINDNSSVKKGEVIAEIRSSLSEKEVLHLKNITKKITNNINSKVEPIDFDDNELLFGVIQDEYNNLKNNYIEYTLNRQNSYEKIKVSNLNKQIKNYQDLLRVNKTQLNLSLENLTNRKEKYLSDKRLYEKNAISKQDFFSREEKYRNYKNSIEDVKKTILNTKIAISSFENEIIELTHKTKMDEFKIIEKIKASIKTIQNEISNWKNNFILIAPFDGTISYLTPLDKEQFIKSGTPIVSVIPKNNQYQAQIKLTTKGYGKIKKGQTVNIKLDNYPYIEYGQLKGIVSDISIIPSSNNKDNSPKYLATVELVNGLKTTYKKYLDYKPNMNGTGEIITEDLRLIERIFNQLKKAIVK